MAIRTHHILLQLVFVHALVGGDAGRHFVILQNDAKNSLLRVSATGETVEVIADGVPGEALMQDASGNYMVLSRHALTQVRPSGEIRVIAKAQAAAYWCAIVGHRDGSYLVADCNSSSITQIDAEGTTKLFATYPGGALPVWDIGMVQQADGILVFRQRDDESLALFRIDWNGKPSDLRLGGVARGPGRSSLHFGDSLLAVNTGKLTPDSENGFYFTEYVGTQSLFHLGPDGTISRDTSFRGLGYGHYPVVYDEVSRTVITANSSIIASVNPNSPESGIRVLSRNRALIAPRDIIWERQLK